MANLTLKTASGSNVITVDSSRVRRRLYRVDAVNTCLSGKRVQDIFGIHYEFTLSWEFMSASLYESLRELFYSGEKLYLDDSNVPPLVETATVPIGTGADLNFVGITSPSGTHKGYITRSVFRPYANKNAFEDAEFSSTDYGKIDGDDSNNIATEGCAVGEYPYHKLMLLSPVAQANITEVTITVKAAGDDRSEAGQTGVRIYGYNGSYFVNLDETTGSTKQTLTFTSSSPEIARTFVDSNDSYVRILVRTRVAAGGSGGWQTVFSDDSFAGLFRVCVFNGKIYAIQFSNDKMVETDPDCTAFTEVGDLHGTAETPVEYGGKLYVTSGYDGGTLWYWNGADSFVSTGTTGHNGMLVVYNGKLYCLDINLYEWDDVNTWTQVAPQPGYEILTDPKVYDDGGGDDLYFGSRYHGRLYRWNNVDACEMVATQYDPKQTSTDTLISFDGDLYAIVGGTLGALLCKWNKSDAWTLVASPPAGYSIYAGIELTEFDDMLIWRDWDGRTYRWEGGPNYLLAAVSIGPDVGTDPHFAVIGNVLYAVQDSDPAILSKYISGSPSDPILRTYYAQVNVNGSSEMEITLTHTPILDGEGDVIWVKNITQVTTLTLDEDYTISGSVITISGQNPGDIIEIKYNHYHEARFKTVPETWLSGDPSSAREREVEITLETLTKSVEGS